MGVNIAELAKRFVGTYLNTDPDPKFEELLAPKVTAWHNFDAEKVTYDGAEFAKDWLLRREDARSLMRDFRVDDFKVHLADSAIIFTQTVTGTLPDGTRVRIPGCVVLGLEDGRIATINSVGDSKQREAFEKALAAMNKSPSAPTSGR